MLTHQDIQRAVARIAPEFAIRKAAYFGSYATGRQSERSDLDILVEFDKPSVSLLSLIGIKNALEDLLKISVDVVHAPLPEDSIITIDRQVPVYG